MDNVLIKNVECGTALGIFGVESSVQLEEGKIADIIILDDGGLSSAPIRNFEDDNIVKRLVSSCQSASV